MSSPVGYFVQKLSLNIFSRGSTMNDIFPSREIQFWRFGKHCMAPPPCHPGVARGGLLTVEHRTTRAKGPSPRPPISMLSLKLTNDVRELSRDPPFRLNIPLSFASNRGALRCQHCWP